MRTETVTPLLRPAGFPRTVTSEQNSFRKLSPLTYGSASLVAGGMTMASLFDAPVEKALSLVGTVLGLLGLGVSLLPKLNINIAKEPVLAGSTGASESTIARRIRQFPQPIFVTSEVAAASNN